VSMNQTLEAVSSTFTLVKDSWDHIMDRHTAEFVGMCVCVCVSVCVSVFVCIMIYIHMSYA
jgi:hypothetical protein